MNTRPSAQTTSPSASSGDVERAQPLTRADWLSFALETLVSDGIDRVKIQVMAKQLGVARSSFYWHFESIDALHKAMLDEWLQKNTGPIIERSMRPAPDINIALIQVFECWLDQKLFNPSLDIAIRLWGRRSEVVHAVVTQADTMRVDALSKMFGRYGFPPKEAVVRARIIYFTQIGQYTLDNIEEPNIRFSYGPEYLHAFTGKMLTPEQEAHLFERVKLHFPDFRSS